jgi:betaine-aldehyde dehydrogenase
MKVRDEQEAIRLANDSIYGLSASVFSRDLPRARRAAEQLDVGAVNINDVLSNVAIGSLPMSGWKTSGLGARNGGAAGVRKFCRQRVITEPRGPAGRSEPNWYSTGARGKRLLDRGMMFYAARGRRKMQPH